MKTVLLTFLALVAAPNIMADDKGKIIEVLSEKPAQPEGKVVMTDAEWKEKLTPEQYRILREDGTERAYGQVYDEFKKHGAGTYHCAGCGAELFTSDEKFDSKCGWPSFYDPSKAKNVKYLSNEENFGLQNSAKLNFLRQTVLELERVT